MQDSTSCRYGTPGGLKKMGTHNRSDNGRCARVALLAHLTYTEPEVCVCRLLLHIVSVMQIPS
jgi:hypothetical protein